MAICFGRCISESGIIEQGFNFAFAPLLGGMCFFFCDSVFGELSPIGGRVVGRSFGMALLPLLHLLGGVAFAPLLLCVAVFPLAVPPTGRGKPHHPKGEGRKAPRPKRRREGSSTTRKGRGTTGEKAAPSKGREGRQHHHKREGNFPSSSFWSGGAFSPSLRSLPDGAAVLCFFWFLFQKK